MLYLSGVKSGSDRSAKSPVFDLGMAGLAQCLGAESKHTSCPLQLLHIDLSIDVHIVRAQIPWYITSNEAAIYRKTIANNAPARSKTFEPISSRWTSSSVDLTDSMSRCRDCFSRGTVSETLRQTMSSHLLNERTSKVFGR